MEQLIIFLLASGLTGFCSAQIAKALDFSMDYGHLFDFIRLHKVRKTAEKKLMYMEFEKTFNESIKIDDFAERSGAIDDLYWSIALKSKNLTLWLCAKCMSHRIVLFLSLIIGLIYFISFGIALIPFIAFYIIAFSFNQYFITR